MSSVAGSRSVYRPLARDHTNDLESGQPLLQSERMSVAAPDDVETEVVDDTSAPPPWGVDAFMVQQPESKGATACPAEWPAELRGCVFAAQGPEGMGNKSIHFCDTEIFFCFSHSSVRKV
eukprot:CAMPEP_0179166484 /NCGR_PEP_ID=MMETSP0796-20121207/81798_1 /TAXON_ID=73915 /ORGANISM="Pyrodinium bahamense, Strain pbaha01" /LENGTH=119 /DNA_ID=CAMNT_0020869085 /DNA_START=1 /DNA_END=357 /DNA_ORIENTATION=-